jgi:hypothetical protein
LRPAFEIAAEWVLKASFFPLQAADAIPGHEAVSETLDSYVQKILPKNYQRTQYSGFFMAYPGTVKPRFHWHTDAQFDGFKPGITVWVPLQDCGVDRPSLQTVDLPDALVMEHILSFSGVSGSPPLGDDPLYQRCFSDDALSLFDKKSYACNAGDAILLTSLTIHATYVPDTVKFQDRIALVMRYSVRS